MNKPIDQYSNQPPFGPIPELYISNNRAKKIKNVALDLPSWDLTSRQICDLELLMNGGFNPLSGFLTEKDYSSVVNSMRLSNGQLWPIPITLDVPESFADELTLGQDIALRDQEGVILAVLTVTDRWQPDKSDEALKVFGTDDITHPGVNYLHNKAASVYLGGPIIGIQSPTHYDFRSRRNTPNQLRAYFRKQGWRKVLALHTRNSLHHAHQESIFQAARQAEANLLLHPVVGLSKSDDVDHFIRVRGYEAALGNYQASITTLSLLNLAMRMAGPREALWHGLIRKNHGCTHFIVEPDHASPGKSSEVKDFYGSCDAQALFREHQFEMGIKMVDFHGEIADPNQVSPHRTQLGFAIFFTGFSGSGKSTIANALISKLMEIGNRPVTLLDGDVVRKHLSSELGFSKEHRDINIRRIGYVASEITKNGGIAICAPIAPYSATRQAVREMIEAYGIFCEVHVTTSLEACEKRDRKGLYKLAREGKIKEFTGISDPYEIPKTPELRIETENASVDHCAHQVMLKLEQLGLISG